MKLLLDEMYPNALADRLHAFGFDAITVADAGLRGASDPDVFEASRAASRVLLTENVADFTFLAAELITSGAHHPGVLIALSSRFSRRASGLAHIAESIRSVAEEQLTDRVVFLAPPAASGQRAGR